MWVILPLLLLGIVSLRLSVFEPRYVLASAPVYVLLLAAVALHFRAKLIRFGLISVMLQWRVNPETVFLLASLNPIQAARMALLSGASSELSVLGPVGFYLSNRVGAQGLYALGVLWPFTLGGVAWAIALVSFRRADIV